MSLKTRIPARLKALFAGVALSRKSIDAITEKEGARLTEESTDEEIDAVLNARNDIWSFDDQRKYDDYQAGKAKKDADDKEAKRLADLAAGKTPEVELPTDAPEWMKTFMTNQAAQTKALQDQIVAIGGEKVTNTRKQEYEKALEGTSDVFKAKALKDFGKMKFETDEEFTEFLTEAETDAADFIQEVSNSGLTNQNPARGVKNVPGQVKVASEAELDAVMTHL